MSPVDVPAEEVVLHQHVLDALLQGLLLLLHETALLSWLLGTRRGSQVAGPGWSLQVVPVLGPRPLPQASATRKRLGEAAPGTDASLPHPPQSPGRQAPPPTSLFAGSSQSWERLKAKQQRTLEGEGGGCQTLARLSPHPHTPCWACRSPGSPHRSSHLIWTQPGLRRKDQGWYHFSTVGRLEQSTSSHRCSTCSLGAGRAPAQRPVPPTSHRPSCV